ncbi:MAG: M81 family metallopeptidase [Chloroflexi bacterium]|nr:M81 family metallopeptidase [Chloroflexota bacterium]
MRLATLGFLHETNTFSLVPADFSNFEVSGILRGEAIAREYRDSQATFAGYFEAAEKLGFEIVPLAYFHTGPIGMITKDAFDRIADELIQLLKQHGPWDGILLFLHGAAVSEEYHDAEGEVAARVRALVGPNVPIGMTSDMHANVTQKMIDNTTATVIYRTNPHLDARRRAFECAEIIVRTIKGEVRPVQALETPPLVINIVKQFTVEEPMLSVVRDVETVITWPGMLSASAAEGYPYADVPEMGAAFLAVHDGDPKAAREAAVWMAKRAWTRRAEFVGDTPSPREALLAAAAAPQRPIVLMDVGDNIGGGSSADSTILLAEAKRLGIRSFLQTLYDPEAVAACVAAAVGRSLTLEVGGKTDDMHGEPVAVTGRVRVISDGQFEDTRPTHGGHRYFDGGTTVVLETTDGHTLVLTSRRIGNTSIEQMYSVGVHPERYQIVVAKGVQSPRPAYTPIAAQVVLVNTPGVTTSDLSFFRYRNIRRPLYPFEPDAAYEPENVKEIAEIAADSRRQ